MVLLPLGQRITICTVGDDRNVSPMTPTLKYFIVAFCFLLLIQTAALAQASRFKVRYLAGSVETRTDKDDWRNNLVILSDEIRVELRDGQRISVDPKAVMSISYGREATRHVARWVALGILVHPIAAVGLLNENVKHFVSIENETADGKKGGLLVQAHKNNYRNVLAHLRGATGKEIERETKNKKQ
jgi:hypothetical protein